jgi:hypothetical protein
LTFSKEKSRHENRDFFQSRARRGLDFGAPKRGCKSFESGCDLKSVRVALPSRVHWVPGLPCDLKNNAILPERILLT